MNSGKRIVIPQVENKGHTNGISTQTGESVKDILSKNTNTKKELIQFTKDIVSEVYGDNSFLELEASGEKRDVLCTNILQKAQSLGIKLDMAASPVREVSRIFGELGYYFIATPVPLDGKYIVTVGLYEEGKKETYPLSKIEIPGLEKVDEEMSITPLMRTLIPDFRSTGDFKKMYGNRMKFTAFASGDSQTGEVKVMIFEENITPNMKFGYNRVQQRRTSILNEVGSYIAAKFLGNPKVFNIPLSLFGIQFGPRDFTLFQFNETIGDYTSLKYGESFKAELMRLLTTNMENYAFSKILVDIAFRNAIRKENFGFIGGKPLEPQLKKLTPEKTGTLKALIIQELDTLLLPIIQTIRSFMPEVEKMLAEKES